MKQLFLLLPFFVFNLCIAQVDFGVKGGINYNSNSFVDIENEIISGFETKTGYHAGLWTRVKIPAIDCYLRPELVFTSLKNEVIAIDNSTASYNFQKIDVPVLLGKKILKVFNVFAGPSFQYLISSELEFNDFIENYESETSGFTLGLQLGGGLEFGKFGVDVRWERAFSDVESTLIDATSTTSDINYDTRVNQLILGVSFKF